VGGFLEMTYSEAIQQADKMGMVDGSIILIIVDGQFQRVEYVIRKLKPIKTIDSVVRKTVDNLDERSPNPQD
jgi:hypothetical protein